jgi:hypothetical protein
MILQPMTGEYIKQNIDALFQAARKGLDTPQHQARERLK